MLSIRPFPIRVQTRWLLAPLLVIALTASCTVTDPERRPLISRAPVVGCAADGEMQNMLEAPQSNPEILRGLTTWEENMVDYGRRRGDDMLAESSYLDRLKLNYYDAQRVFLQIADYTGDEQPWHRYAETAESVYKTYLEKNEFRVAGYMRFPHGLFMDWQRTGDQQSLDYLLRMRDRGAFSNPEEPRFSKQWRDARYSREVAYALENQVLAERAGAPAQTARVELYVDMAIDHIDAWVTGDFGHDDPEWRFCQAFMAGLTASALIAYDDHREATGRSRDPRILPRVQSLADWLWQTMWIAGVGGSRGDWYPYESSPVGAFEYVQPTVDRVGSESPAPDTSLLVVPMYGWLYARTGETRFRDRGDAIFAGGVEMGSLEQNKQFNQSYRSSFDYVEWRKAGSITAADN